MDPGRCRRAGLAVIVSIVAASAGQEGVGGIEGSAAGGEEGFGVLAPIGGGAPHRGKQGHRAGGGGKRVRPELAESQGSGIAAGWYCTSIKDETPAYAYNDMNCDGSGKTQNCGQAWCCRAVGYECSKSHRVGEAACDATKIPRCQGDAAKMLMESQGTHGKKVKLRKLTDPPPHSRLAEAQGDSSKNSKKESKAAAEKGGGAKGTTHTHTHTIEIHQTTVHHYEDDEDEPLSDDQKTLRVMQKKLYRANQAAFAATSAMSAKKANSEVHEKLRAGIINPADEHIQNVQKAFDTASANAAVFNITVVTSDAVRVQQEVARQAAAEVAHWETRVAQGARADSARERAKDLAKGILKTPEEEAKQLKKAMRKLAREDRTLKEVQTKSVKAKRQTNTKMEDLKHQEAETDELTTLLTNLRVSTAHAKASLVTNAGRLKHSAEVLRLQKGVLERARDARKDGGSKADVVKAEASLAAARREYDLDKENHMRTKELLVKYKEAGETAKDIDAGEKANPPACRLLQSQIEKKKEELAQMTDDAEAKQLQVTLADLDEQKMRIPGCGGTADGVAAEVSKEETVAESKEKAQILREKATKATEKQTDLALRMDRAKERLRKATGKDDELQRRLKTSMLRLSELGSMNVSVAMATQKNFDHVVNSTKTKSEALTQDEEDLKKQLKLAEQGEQAASNGTKPAEKNFVKTLEDRLRRVKKAASAAAQRYAVMSKVGELGRKLAATNNQLAVMTKPVSVLEGEASKLTKQLSATTKEYQNIMQQYEARTNVQEKQALYTKASDLKKNLIRLREKTVQTNNALRKWNFVREARDLSAKIDGARAAVQNEPAGSDKITGLELRVLRLQKRLGKLNSEQTSVEMQRLGDSSALLKKQHILNAQMLKSAQHEAASGTSAKAKVLAMISVERLQDEMDVLARKQESNFQRAKVLAEHRKIEGAQARVLDAETFGTHTGPPLKTLQKRLHEAKQSLFKEEQIQIGIEEKNIAFVESRIGKLNKEVSGIDSSSNKAVDKMRLEHLRRQIGALQQTLETSKKSVQEAQLTLKAGKIKMQILQAQSAAEKVAQLDPSNVEAELHRLQALKQKPPEQIQKAMKLATEVAAAADERDAARAELEKLEPEKTVLERQ
jgi:hypothetical protein